MCAKREKHKIVSIILNKCLIKHCADDAIDDATASSHVSNYHMEYQSYWKIGTIAQL